MKVISYVCFFIISMPILSKEIEIIRGIMTSDNGIIFNVDSNGCTIKEDFEVSVSKKDEHNIILLQRIRTDLCRSYLPNGIKIFFTYEELGFDEGLFMMANPIVGYFAPALW